MVNHVYTLLLDRPGLGFATGEAEEYTPPDYRPVPLPGYLRAVRAVLFGAAPDRRAATYRARQFLAVLHAGPLAGHVTRDDPRITYLPLAGAGFELAPHLEVAALGGHAYELALGGAPPAGTVAGRTESAWTVAVAGGGTQLVVAVGAAAAQLRPLTFYLGLSMPVPLPGAALTVRVRQGVPDGTAWWVTVAGRPEADLGDLATQLEGAGAAALEDLFGAAAAEPYATYRNLWRSRRPMADRLSALLLATALRTDEARRPGGP